MAVSEKMVDAALDAAEFVPYQWREMPFADQWQARMRRALEAAEAVRGGDAAPPAGTVPVRVAVAFDEAGQPHIYHCGSDVEAGFGWLAEDYCATRRSCIATIHAPLRDVPEVGAVVEGVDRG